ncbi:LicD family protein [Mesorhizobium marinum]|uniref:Phosphorylcholine transferase LicD n=1 Tax=Mesorhizobium marinum TaxID=3228790 RepID=A0ABV3QX31_9HYPH
MVAPKIQNSGSHMSATSASPMSMDDIHANLLEILEQVVSICDSEGIEVFLIGGGCLGLVRHGGFVPWDDDLDLAIWAGDVPAFLLAMNQLPTHLAVRAEPPDYHPAYGHPLYKVMDARTRVTGGDALDGDGVFIDIVPMMHWKGRITKSIESRFCRIGGLRNFRPREDLKHSPLREFGRSLALGFLRRVLHPIFLRQDAECRAKKAGIVTGAFGRKWVGRFEYDVVFPLQRTTFCGVSVLAPRDIHGFLVRRYDANYMTVPDERSRWRHFTSASVVEDQ